VNPETHKKIALFLDLTIKTSSIMMIALAFHDAYHGAPIGHIVVLGCGSITFAIHGYGK
jgi:hypothetical protein